MSNRTEAELLELAANTLCELEDFLDDFADVIDSPDGVQEANKAMRMLSTVQDVLKELGR